MTRIQHHRGRIRSRPSPRVRSGTMIAAPVETVHLRFDRGTIVLANMPAGLDLTGAPGVLWDARVAGSPRPGLHARGGGALATRPGDSFCRWAHSDRWGPRPAGPTLASATTRPLRSVPGNWPAGVEWSYFRRAAARPASRWVLWPRRAFRRSAWCRRASFSSSGSARSPRSIPTRSAAMATGVATCRPVTVATYESAYRHMDHLGARFGLLIVDEVHHFGCGFRDEALEMTLANARLGLTATPPRDAAHAIRLAELVGPTVYELAIGDLTGRFLASFDTVVLHLDLTEAERTRYAALSQSLHQHPGRAPPDGAPGDVARCRAGGRPNGGGTTRPRGLARGAAAPGPDGREAACPAGAPRPSPRRARARVHRRQRQRLCHRAGAPHHAL